MPVVLSPCRLSPDGDVNLHPRTALLQLKQTVRISLIGDARPFSLYSLPSDGFAASCAKFL